MDEVSLGQQLLTYLRIGLLQLELHAGWAAWLQAVGSIAALAAVFWIANAQSRRARIERRIQRKLYLTAVMELADETLSTVRSAAGAITTSGCRSNPEYDLRPFEDLSAALHSVSLERLGSGKAILSLHSLRRILFEVRSLVEQARAEGERSGTVRLSISETAQRCVTEAETATEALKNAFW